MTNRAWGILCLFFVLFLLGVICIITAIYGIGPTPPWDVYGFVCGLACFSPLLICLRERRRLKQEEFSVVVNKCRQHPDKDIQDVVREAVQGAKYWTFKTVWKKLRDSYDYGCVYRIYR